MKSPDRPEFGLEDDPLWYKDAIIYELHVKSYFDSNGDGIGDFRGLTEKLDYLQDLGITAIWLLPFYPSPLRDDGYDISEYTGIHPSYGTMADFKKFLKEAHRRGLRVITELVLNHTSDLHPWFQRARQAKAGNDVRKFYVWSDNPDNYSEARIIFKDFEHSNWAWDAVAKAYYWHRFYSHQPDLNFDHPPVQRALTRVIDFWLALGVDGLRLDAVPYLFEREGTNCENLPETYEFLQTLRAHIDRTFANRMVLAEANQWPEDAVAYFGAGNMCHMAFHFPVMPRMFMAIYMEDRFPILDILEQTPRIPDRCQWAVFLRNHDELTLEMVTDEERDYMYRVYAYDRKMRINLGIRRRLAPLLRNNRRRIELMKGLLFSLPGTPVIYYGDEIRMGDNIYLGDRDGVRTPMQWNADRNAGFSRANPQQLFLPVIIDPEYHYEARNVETEYHNQQSFLWWMKRLASLRKQFKAFGRGSIQFLHPENRKVLAFIRRYENEVLLVVANLSRFAQGADLDLSAFAGMIPVELFGRTEFPVITERPYFFTLGPHAFYWFSLEARGREQIIQRSERRGTALDIPVISLAGPWQGVFNKKTKPILESVLGQWIKTQRWFSGKARTIKSASLKERIPISYQGQDFFITLLQVEYTVESPEIYVVPLAFSTSDDGAQNMPQAAVCRINMPASGADGILFDAVADKTFCAYLLRMIGYRRQPKGLDGELTATTTRVFRFLRGSEEEVLESSVIRAEQANTSIVYGDRFILKLIRRLETGINPDLEIGRFLTEHQFPCVPLVAGAIEYQLEGEEPKTVAILQSFVKNEGDAWTYTLDVLRYYFETALARRENVLIDGKPEWSMLDLVEREIPSEVCMSIGPYAEIVRVLGQRTAECHGSLASEADNPDFAPEPFSKLYQRSLYQSMRTLTGEVFRLVQHRLPMFPEDVQNRMKNILQHKSDILARFGLLLRMKISAKRIRIHGDFHLGQVLYTGKDVVLIDFEGEAVRPITERRIKRSALRDVAGMLRSFHYVSCAALFSQQENGMIAPDDATYLEAVTRAWQQWVSAIFLKSYLETAARGEFLPQTREELSALLGIYLLEKALYELGYELNNRPDWVRIPLDGIHQLMGRTME